jgi:hypothetical protein
VVAGNDGWKHGVTSHVTGKVGPDHCGLSVRQVVSARTTEVSIWRSGTVQ